MKRVECSSTLGCFGTTNVKGLLISNCYRIACVCEGRREWGSLATPFKTLHGTGGERGLMMFKVGYCFIQINVLLLLLFKAVLSTRRTLMKMV